MTTRFVHVVRGPVSASSSPTTNSAEDRQRSAIGLSFTKREADGLYVITRIREGGPSHQTGQLNVDDILRQVCPESAVSVKAL
jgi:hypothetical protein